jgi:hypothetical protein
VYQALKLQKIYGAGKVKIHEKTFTNRMKATQWESQKIKGGVDRGEKLPGNIRGRR